jgi:hypothetical protein
MGRGIGADSHVILVNADSYGIGICGNVFYECGDGEVLAGVAYGIHLDGCPASRINGNTFYNFYGRQHATGQGYCVFDVGNSVGQQICNNSIIETVVGAGSRVSPGAFQRIYTESSQCQVNDNCYKLIGGTSYAKSTGSDIIFWLDSLSTGMMFCNNHFSAWDNTAVAGTFKAVAVIGGANATIIGNFSNAVPDFVCTGGSGMALGNNCPGAGTLLLGSHQTTGNIT